MLKPLLLKIAIAGIAVTAPAAALVAQAGWVPGSEIAGQTVQVQTNGVVNSIYFGADGTASIGTPSGTTVPGTWSATGGQLCLSANGGQECWPYQQPFQPGQQMAMTSSCQQVSTFLAQSTNAPTQENAGERG